MSDNLQDFGAALRQKYIKGYVLVRVLGQAQKTDAYILPIAPLIVTSCEKFEIWFQSSTPVALSRFETKQFI